MNQLLRELQGREFELLTASWNTYSNNAETTITDYERLDNFRRYLLENINLEDFRDSLTEELQLLFDKRKRAQFFKKTLSDNNIFNMYLANNMFIIENN